MKKFITILCLIFFTNSAFAAQNYTFTRVENEQYSASTPVGYFEEFNTNGNPVFINNDSFHNVNYVVETPSSASIQDIYTPQSYNKSKVVTETYKDERETIDKVIERAGTVSITLGILGLITLGILNILNVI